MGMAPSRRPLVRAGARVAADSAEPGIQRFEWLARRYRRLGNPHSASRGTGPVRISELFHVADQPTAFSGSKRPHAIPNLVPDARTALEETMCPAHTALT